MEDRDNQRSIWLEVANVRRVEKGVEIQVKGDRADREPVWWRVDSHTAGFIKSGVAKDSGSPPNSDDDHDAAYRAIADGLDKKRIVLANLAGAGNWLECKSIRVQYAESSR